MVIENMVKPLERKGYYKHRPQNLLLFLQSTGVYLRYKPVGRGFNCRWCHWNFSLTKPSGRTVALGSTQPLTEVSTRCISWR